MTALRENEKLISLEDTQPNLLKRQVKASRKDFTLILIGSATLLPLIGLSQWFGLLLPLRLVLGCAYILFVPGYCLAAALFPRDDDLDGIERIGLSLGLSIAWVPVLALILDALPWGLRLWPIVTGELVSIALFSALALWRRGLLPESEAYAPPLAWHPRPWWGSLSTPDRHAYQFIFIALTLTALALAWTFLVPTPDEFMTEFYMLGPDGLAEDFPREATLGEQIKVTLGLANLERGVHTYRVEAWAVDPWAEGRRQLLGEDGPLEIARGERREWTISWQMPWQGQDQKVEFLLFMDGSPEPYRSLRLWLNVADG